MVGGLQYFTLTRPEISFAVGLVDKFMQSPRVPHLVVAKRILRLRYIKEKLDSSGNLAITAYPYSISKAWQPLPLKAEVMLVMLQIVAPLLAFAFSSVTLNYLGRARKRQWLLALVQKPSKGLLLILHQRFFCCDGYLWESLFLGLLFSFVTTRVLSK